MAIAFGIKIILQDKGNPVSQDTDIGLYNVSGDNSEFRWIQNEITGLSTTWKYGMIVINGISKFSIEIDLRGGGNTSYPGSGSVSIVNIDNFKQTIEDASIVITGLKLEIWELGTGDHQKRVRTYFCEEPKWDTKKYVIPFKGGQSKRVANIVNVVSSAQYPYASPESFGKSVPATFGKLIPYADPDLEEITRNSIAKLVKTYDREDYTFSDAFFTGSEFTETKIFPLNARFINLGYQFSLRTDVPQSTPPSLFYTTYPENTYLKIIDGTGEGQIRKVDYYRTYANTEDLMVYVTDYFETELLDDDTGDGRSWGKLFTVNKRNDADHFVCDGFYNISDEKQTSGAEIYIANNDSRLESIAPYGYDIDVETDANNKLRIDPKVFDQGDLSNQDSFLILPVPTFYVPADEDLSVWSAPTYVKEDDGLYESGDAPTSISSNSIINLENAYDKDSTTYGRHTVSASDSGGSSFLCKALYFDMPTLPRNFEFDSCYIGLKARTELTTSAGMLRSFYILLRRFKLNYFSNTLYNGDPATEDEITYDDLPDFYYSDDPDTKNEYFYVNNSITTAYSGYSNAVFETEITSREIYDAYVQGTFLTYLLTSGVTSYTDVTDIYELAFIFKKSSNVDQIYSPMHGRVFAYTWDGRKTTTDLIDTPSEFLEHVCRLQNYQDTCDTPVTGWGLQYADLPLIATSGYGSFDDADLASVRDFEVAGQVYEYNDGYTDKLKNKICKEFVLANWQDKDGKERVIPIPNDALEPVYTVYMSDILDRTKIKLSQLPEKRIISEPVVKYNYNPVTSEYDDIIQITNSSAGSFSLSFASGIDNETKAEELWNACHSLSLRTHKLNKPTTDQTDLKWANGCGGYTISLNYLENWVNWQFTEEIVFPVHYNICASWEECTPINIVFSHYTNNTVKSALVEEIVVNPDPGYDCSVKAIIYR